MDPEEQLDADIEHQTDVQKHALHLGALLAALLLSLRRTVTITVMENRIGQPLANQLRAPLARVYKDALQALTGNLQTYARTERTFQQSLYPDRARAANLAEIDNLIKNQSMVGRTLEEWMTGMGNNTFLKVQDAIRMGALAETAASEVATTVGAVLDRAAGGMQGLARTGTTHAAAVVRGQVYSGKVQWVSVLDARTTEYCREHHGNIYPEDEGPRPPAHWNCRSSIVPYVPGLDIPHFDDWIKKQLPERKKAILGRLPEGKSSGFAALPDQQMTLSQLMNKNKRLVS